MKIVSVRLLVIAAVSLHAYPGGAVVPIPLQVVPQGIKSVNGSDVNMGCAVQPPTFSGMQICGSFGAEGGATSCLVDGNSPIIDTSTSNWASQLVTVRKNRKNEDITFDHVVLTFDFDIAMSPTAIELDLFLCPEWNIGAPYISVYANESNSSSGLIFNDHSVLTGTIDFIKHYTPSQSSCDSLTYVNIPLEEQVKDLFYFTWHIAVSFDLQPNIQWVHVGEVRFLVSAAHPDPIPKLTTIQISPQPSSSVRGSSALGSKAPTTTIASSPTAMGGPHVSTHPSTDLTVTTIQPSSETQPSSSLSGSDVLGSRAPTTTIASSPTASMGVSTHPSTYLTTIQPSPSESSSVRSSSALGRRALTTSSPTASMSGESSGSLPLPLLIGVIAVLLGAITLFFIFFITNTCRIHNRKVATVTNRAYGVTQNPESSIPEINGRTSEEPFYDYITIDKPHPPLPASDFPLPVINMSINTAYGITQGSGSAPIDTKVFSAAH